MFRTNIIHVNSKFAALDISPLQLVDKLRETIQFYVVD